MEEGRENISRDEARGARPQIFGTDPDNPGDGRIFVWTKLGWFERIEGESKDVAFTPVAKSEEELREFISRNDPSVDLVPLSGEYRKRVFDEFLEQSPLYSGSPERSNEGSSPDDVLSNTDDDIDDDEQEYHQHN